MPGLLSSLVKVPAGDLGGAIAASGDSSRACLREWLAQVPDHRSVTGRWHQPEFVLALAICAFTAAGHDSPAAAAEWAAGCSQHTLAVLGGQRDPWAQRIRAPSTLRCPELSGQGSNRILVRKGTGSSAGETETIYSRVQGAGRQEGGR